MLRINLRCKRAFSGIFLTLCLFWAFRPSTFLHGEGHLQMALWWLTLTSTGQDVESPEISLWACLWGLSRSGWPLAMLVRDFLNWDGNTYPTSGWHHSWGLGLGLHKKRRASRAQVVITLCFLTGGARWPVALGSTTVRFHCDALELWARITLPPLSCFCKSILSQQQEGWLTQI